MVVESRLAVPGVAGYLVSDLGNVYSLWRQEWRGRAGRFQGSSLVIVPDSPRMLTPFDRKNRKGEPTGYLSVSLGRRVIRYVHELVLLAFVGPRPSPEHEACHGLGGRSDNRLSNLRWGTTRENCQDRIMVGTQYAGDAWRMARGMLPAGLVGTEIADNDHEREHAFADMLGAAE